MIMKLRLMLLLMLLSSAMLVAAQTTVTGRVTSGATGNPAEGISVSVKGTKKGVITTSSGLFSITAKRGDLLVFSGIGFAPKEVEVTGESMEVVLTAAAGDLGEVVVVGYGTQRKGNITSAVATVKGGDLIKRPLASTSMGLQGFAPGVVVQQGSGQPGADGGVINIRGIGSINGSSAPLIIVDGVEGVSLNDIDPNIIENISILKDAASTAVYGVRGTNGVILVKTKRGQAGKTSISFNSFVTHQTPTNFPELLSPVDDMILNNEAVSNTGSTVLPFPQSIIDLYRNNSPDNFTVFNTDWKDLIFQNSGFMQNHNVIISGGSDKVNYLASGTYLNQQGLVVNNYFKKYDLRLNGDINLTSKIKFSTDLFYTNASSGQPAGMSPVEIIQRGISYSRRFPGKFPNGLYGDGGQSNRINPVAAAENSGFQVANTPTLSIRFGITAELFKNFVLEASYNTRNSWTESYEARGTYDVYNPNPSTQSYVYAQTIGDSALTYTNNRSYNNQYYVSGSYAYSYKKDHNFKIQAAFQALDTRFTTVSATRQGLPNPNFPYLNLGTSSAMPGASGSGFENALAGFLGRFNYSYKQKYLFEFTGRYDGTSRFSQKLDLQWGFFPGFSAGWVFSKEKFMDKVSFINFGKLRVSYGGLGNQSIGGTSNNNYPFTALINPGTAYYFNNLLVRGASINNIPNEVLSWETSNQSNIGLDLVMLRNKLSLTVDVYEKRINEMITALPLPLALGYPTSSTIPSNASSMVNKGWEVSLTYRDKAGKLNYSVTGNVSDVRNKVLDTRNLDIVNGIQVSRAGFPVNSYFLYRTNGLYQTRDDVTKPYNTFRTTTTGPGDIRYLDVTGNDTVNAADRVLVGNNFPRYDYSVNINLDYKGFDLNIFMFGVGKRDNYISGIAVQPFNAGNWIASGLNSALDRWTPSNTEAKYPRLFSGGNQNYAGSDYWLRSGAFFRIKHITLGYSLPKKLIDRLKIQQLRFYVSTVNPLTISKYEPGFDPEPSNVNGALYPIMKTYTAGINLRF
jgi:TonB-linked SusC/RagA family outer membrane protein